MKRKTKGLALVYPLCVTVFHKIVCICKLPLTDVFYLKVPCSAGTFLDTSDPMKPACKDCPVGTYKEIPEDLACIPCPTGTITEATGAMNITSCLSMT